MEGQQISSWPEVFDCERRKFNIGMVIVELRRTDGCGPANLPLIYSTGIVDGVCLRYGGRMGEW